MYVSRVLSYMSGWQLLLTDKSSEWAELTDAISTLASAESVQTSLANTLLPESYIDPRQFQYSGETTLRAKGWTTTRVKSSRISGLRIVFRLLKNKVSVRVLASEGISYSFATWLLVDVPRGNDQDVSELSVLIVPMASVKSAARSRELFTFERCRVQLQDLLPLRHTAPFVIIGVSSENRAVEIEELEPDRRFVTDDHEVVEKSIEFPQEYYQAGVSILSYFGEVLKQKHPWMRARVRIEQDGLIVRLLIESASGDIEIIERTLEEYGLVVSRQLSPEAMFESPLQIAALEHKLELANAEIRSYQRLLALAEGRYQERVGDLHEEITNLRTYIGRHLSQVDTAHALLARQCEANEKLLLAHVSQADTLIKDLIRQAADNRAVAEALATIDEKLTAGVTPADEEAVNRALVVIHREKPTIFTQLQSAALNLSYEVSGSYLFKWIEAFASKV